MSKKSVRTRNSFSKRWAAIISGSLFFVTSHAALAAQDDRPKFRDFRQQNAGIDRNALRKMYNNQFRGGKEKNAGQIRLQPVLPQANSAKDVVRVNGVTRRLEKRLEKRGYLNHSIQQIDQNLINTRGGVNLDLSSSVRNITLGGNLFNNAGSVEISVGGETKTVQAGSQVSAAEYIAVKQILAGSAQKIIINSAGAATGGDVDLSAITADKDVMRASDLVVPVNVTTYGDFSKRSDFKLLGDLNNFGTVHTYSSRNSVKGGAIRADDIVNQSGALISSDVDLALYASGNLTNLGVITSKGSLTLSAGDTLTNSGSASSKRDLNLYASTIVNSGSAASSKGNINIDGSALAELNVNGQGGTFSAHNAINVRSSDYAGTFNTNVYGGDFLSKELNLNAGNAVMQAHVGELTGVVSQTGAEAHISASTDNLVLGEVCLTGDPTFKNDSGNITITGNITVAADLSIIASGDILSNNNLTLRAADGTQGYNITLIAGADQVAGGVDSTVLPGGGTPEATSLTGVASASGGSVLLGSNVNINTRSTGTGAGGDVLIAAFAGAGIGSGRVNVGQGTSTISTGGITGTDANGDVTIIAGAQNTTAAIIGNIDTTGGNTTTGTINITTTQPISSDGANVDYAANGSISSGNSIIAGPGVSPGATVAFARNVLSNTDIFVDADQIVTQVGSSVTSNNGTINFNSANGIVGAGVGSLVSAPNINLVSQNTDIGTLATRLRVDADNLYVDAPLGSVFVEDMDDVALLAATVAGDFNILAQGTLTNTGQVAGGTITFRSVGGNVNALAPVIGVTGVDLRAGFNLEGTAQITSPFISVRSDLAGIGTVNPLQIDADVLSVNAPNGSARLIDINSVDVGGGTSSVFGTFNLTANFAISNSSDITANVVNFTATNGVFSLSQVITGLTAINLTAGQSIQNADLGGALVSPSINLTSTLANIGTSSAIPLTIDAQSVTLNAANGNVWFADPNSVILGSGNSSAGTVFQVTAGTDLSSTGNIFAQDVRLEATNGGFDLDGLVSGTNSITLESFDDIDNFSISGGLDNGFGGAVPNLDLTTTGGSIGTFLNPLQIDADNLTFDAFFGAFIQDANSLTIAGNSVAGTDVTIQVGNDFTNTAMIDANGNILVIADQDIDVQATINAGGNLDLVADQTVNVDEPISATNNATIVAGTSFGSTQAINAGNDVSIFAGSNVTPVSTITAGNNVTLVSTNGSVSTLDTIDAGNNVTISGAAGVSAFGSVSASAGDVLLASALGNIQTIGVTTAGNDIVMTATTGSIETFDSLNAGNSILLLAENQIQTFASITSTAGDVIIDSQLDQVNLFGSVAAGADVIIEADTDVNALDEVVAGGNVFVFAGDDINLNGGVTANDGFIDLFAGNDINANGLLDSTEDIFMFAGNNANLSNMSAGTFIDVFALGDINSGGTVFSFGDVFMSADGSVQAFNISAIGDIDLSGNNGVTTTGTVAGEEVFLTSFDAGIQINAPLSALLGVTLTSNDSILDANIAGGITSPAIHLTSFSGDIGASGDFLDLDTVDLTANAFTGNVYIETAGSVNLADEFTGSSAFSDFVVFANGDLTSTGTVSGNDVNLAAFGGSVDLGADVTATTSVTISATGAGSSITNTAGTTVSAPDVTLLADTDICTDEFSRFNINADTVNITATNGSAFIDESDSVDIFFASAAGMLDVRAAGDLTSTGTITGDDVILEATGGALGLTDLVTGNNSITLTSFGTIDDFSVIGGLASPQINLNSTAGNIFIFSVDFTNVTANAFQFVLLQDSSGDINIGGGASSSGLSFTVTSVGGNVTSTGSISSGANVVIDASSGVGTGVNLGGSVTAVDTISISTQSTIDDTSITGGLFAPNINLTSLAGDVDISTVDFTNVAANSLSGFVALADTSGSMNLGTSISNSAATSFGASAPVDLTSTDSVTATTVSLTATSGSLDLGGLTDGAAINLTSSATIDNGSISGGLESSGGPVGQLNLLSTDGNIGTSAIIPLTFDAINVTANAPTGSVWISDTGALGDNNLIINGASGAATTFLASAVGDLSSTAAGTIDAQQVALLAQNGQFDLDGQVTGTALIDLFSLAADILNSNVSGGLVTPVLVLNAANVGASGDALVVDVTDIDVTAAGDIFVADAGDLNVLSATAGGDVEIVAGNDLSSTGIISGVNVVLEATAGGFDLDGEVRGSNSISLTSNAGILNDNVSGGLTGGAGVFVPNLALVSLSGDIGAAGAGNALNIDAGSLQVNAALGSVFVNDTGALGNGSLTISGVSQALNVFQVTALVNLGSLAGATISGDSVFLTATGGSLDLDGQVTAVTNIVLTSFDDLLDSSVTGGISAPLVDLVSTGGSINITAVDFDNVTANALDNVNISDINSMNFGPGSSSASNGQFIATAATDLTSTGSISAGTDVILEATNGLLDLDGAVSGGTSITLRSDATIDDFSIDGGITSAQVNLVSFNNDINITLTDFDNVTANAAGFVTLIDILGSMNLGGGASSAGTTFAAGSVGNLTSTGTVSGVDVDLATGGSFDLAALVSGSNSITLVGNDSIFNESLSGGLDNGGGGAVPQLNLTSNNGNIGTPLNPLAIDADSLTANAPNGSVFIIDDNNLILGGGTSTADSTFAVSANGTLTVNSAVSADLLFLDSGSGMTLNADVTGTVGVGLASGAGLSQTGGTVFGGGLSVEFAAGSATLDTDVDSIETFNSVGRTLTLNEFDDIVLVSQSIGTLNINAAGDISTALGIDISAANFNFVSSGGSILINSSVTGNTSVTLDTSAGAGSIEQTAGTVVTPALTLLAGAGGIGVNGNVLLVNGPSPITVTAQATGGDVFVNYTGNSTITLNGSTGNDNFTVNAFTGNIATAGDIDGTGLLDLSALSITNANTLSFNTIVVDNVASGTNLTINGGAGGFWNSAAGTTFTALEGDMIFNGAVTFGGTAGATLTVSDLGGANNFFIVNLGANVVGQNQLTVNACDLILTGGLSGNPLVVNCADAGTIANNAGNGDINLTGNIVFNGASFAILAAGNVNTVGATLIDLTGTTNGGNLTIMAGFNFTPATVGQTQNSDLYTLTGPSAQGGNINLGTVNISTVGNSGNGGSVTAVAKDGLTNSGSIALGSIATSGTATSGQVRIIGEGGVTVGDIDTTGGITSGNVTVAVAEPTISGTITVQDGVVSGGTFLVGTATDGNIVVNNIVAPGRDITLTGALAVGNTITQGVGLVSANRLFINTGSGNAIISNSDVNQLTTTGSGAVVLSNEVGAITLNGLGGALQDVNVSAETITVAGAGINVDNLVLVANNPGNNAIIVNAAINATNVDLATNGNIVLNSNVTAANLIELDTGGGISQTSGTLNAIDLKVAFGTGPVTLATNVNTLETLSPGTLTLNESNNITLNAQQITNLTVNSAAGNIFTDANFGVDNLTLNAAAGTVSITNALIATNTATLTGAQGMTTTAGGSVTADNVILSSANVIGTDNANRFVVAANNLRVAAAQNAFVSSTLGGSVALGNSNATGTLDIAAAGDITGAGNLSAGNLVLNTLGSFDLTGNLAGTTSVRLTAFDSIVNGDFAGAITTPSLILTSLNGDIGIDEFNRFNVAAGTTTISGNAAAPTGSVFINSLSTTGVNVAASGAGNDLFFSATGGLTVNGNLQSDNGDISLTTLGGNLTVSPGVNVLAFSSISLINTTTVKSNRIILGANSSLITNAKIAGLGDVTIAIGNSILPPGGNSKVPKFTTVIENGGTVDFVGKKARGLAPQNTFTAQGADVLVSNTLRNKAIEIGGGVIVTADPPVPVGTPVYMSYGKGAQSGTGAHQYLIAATGITGDALGLTAAAVPGALMPIAGTADLQLISLNNAIGSDSLLAGARHASPVVAIPVAGKLAPVPSGGQIDDSFITTSAPQGFDADVSVCTDMQLGLAQQAGTAAISSMPHAECLTLENGRVLFAAAKDMTVVTPKGTVKLAAGSLALVVADADHLSVYDVNDLSKRSVTVEAGGRSIHLSPGRHVTVTGKHVNQFCDINAVEAMMHRNVASQQLSSSHKAFTTEFSLPSAIEVLKPLKALVTTEHPEAQKLAAKVIKTSAIIMQLSQGSAPYEFHVKPKTVALNW